jgi:hypothetical protein
MPYICLGISLLFLVIAAIFGRESLAAISAISCIIDAIALHYFANRR